VDRTLETSLLGAELLRHSLDETTSTNWLRRVPQLIGDRVRLRELRASDAASLNAMLSSEDVSKFISAPPETVDGFEQFIKWALRGRAAGECLCFAVTMEGNDTAIGVFQVRQLDREFRTAEWGFAIGSPFWGTGIFEESAELVLDFVFETMNVHRLEARAAVPNGRGNGALLKIGAVQEAVLRQSFLRHGRAIDQVLYALLKEDWRALRAAGRRPAQPVQVH
jgi:[ribosomal protein S5]-alanine N-acetyltransferase